MKFCAAIFVFFIASIAVEIGDTLSLDSLRGLLFPRDPQLIRVRHAEDAPDDTYAVLDTVGLIEKHGYPAEEHNITTEDGYNIVIFRIPGSPKTPRKKGSPVVFLQHGFILSSDCWVLMGPSSDLAFMLADAGYDVWLGNSRGNTYCRSHVNMTIMDKEFWNFSIHEMGTIDIPNLIDYVLDYTDQKTLVYIGHSLGAVMTYVLLSERPEYNDKITLKIDLATTGFSGRTFSTFHTILIPSRNLLKAITEALDVHDLMPQTRLNPAFGRAFCSPNAITLPLCLKLNDQVLGPSNKEFNISLIPYILSYFPAGASTKTLFHMLQVFDQGVFAQHDYGFDANLKIYGTEQPPIYDMSKVTTPVALFWGQTDAIGTETNIKKAGELLPNVVALERVPTELFNHMDFLVTPVAKDLLYGRIMQLVSTYSKTQLRKIGSN